ncbi:Y-family DNA polymerase [Flavobacterium sp. PLA-1-15]|uniref:Y-family DNA polymerase n=1 Tax=Flavobacterium sp. PLA-1-15 TaxID=3380533 RepID=UPI003B7AC59F
MYALIDGNNFFASCERVGNPGLVGKPVIVLSNNDGNAIARSNEAKAIGIKMGDPLFKIKDIVKQHDVKVYSSNYGLYGDMSNRMLDIIRMQIPYVEPYSIDEAFGMMHGISKQYEICVQLRHNIYKWIGIPTSIGLAPTKSLAKVANKIAKKFPERTGSVYAIDSEEKRIKALKWTEIDDVWGIGRAYANKLKSKGIFTAYDFVTKVSGDWVKKNMTIVGYRLQLDLQGISTLFFEDIQDKQNIACTRSFERNIQDKKYLEERICTFSANVAEKLRGQKTHCSMIYVFLNTNRFRPDLPSYNPGVYFATDYPTNSTFEITRAALKGLSSIFREGFDYKKAGIIVSGITPESSYQLSFFGSEKPKDQDAMKAIDLLNKKYGRHKIAFGGQDITRIMKMRQHNVSRNFAGNWNELIEL